MWAALLVAGSWADAVTGRIAIERFAAVQLLPPAVIWQLIRRVERRVRVRSRYDPNALTTTGADRIAGLIANDPIYRARQYRRWRAWNAAYTRWARVRHLAVLNALPPPAGPVHCPNNPPCGIVLSTTGRCACEP